MFAMPPKARKGYSESKKGFYLIAFTTTIHKATELDFEHEQDYALEILAKFHHTLPKLLHLEKAREYSTVDGAQTTYYTMLGKIVLGKISISHIALFDNVDIKYLYQNKVTSRQWKKAQGISDYHKHYNKDGSRLSLRDYRRLSSASRRKLKEQQTY